MKLVVEEIGGAEARGHIAEDVEKIHRAWTNSLPLPIALWTRPCATGENGSENGGENGGENGNDAGLILNRYNGPLELTYWESTWPVL